MRGRRIITAVAVGVTSLAMYHGTTTDTRLSSASVSGTQVTGARNAVAYLKSQLLADGGLPSEFTSGADAGSTCDMVEGASAAGIDPSTLSNGGDTAMQYLKAETGDSTVLSSAGKLGKLMLGIVADRQDPATYGSNNLNTALAALYTARTGSYGDGETASQAFAMLGLIADRSGVSPAAVSYLEGLRDSDGGWNYTNRANASAGSDTNSTAVALMALDAAGHHEDDAAALTWLRAQQDADAGFPYQAGFGSDVDSTALVVQALVATGQDPAAWAKGSATPVTYMESQQAANGGFGFQGAAPDPFTTSQVPAGLLEQPFPVTPAFTATSPTASATATPTGSAMATPSPTASASASPTATPTPTGGISWITSTPLPTPVATALPSTTRTTTHVPAAVTSSPATPGAVASATPAGPTPVSQVLAVTTTPTPEPISTAVASAGPRVSGGAGAVWIAYILAAFAGLLGVVGGGITVRRLRS